MPHTRKNRGSRQDHHYDEMKGHVGHRLPMHASTFHGLQEWHNAKFEKLGWMVLAKAKGYGYKIADYKKSIHHLILSIEHVKEEYSEADRKHDLHVLWMNAKVLEEFVKKNL